jgi:hypothetical protein
MSEASWSPLAYFKELHLLPRVVFTMGGFLFLSSTVVRDVVLTLFRVGIILAAVGFNFLLNLTWMEPDHPIGAIFLWSRFRRP